MSLIKSLKNRFIMYRKPDHKNVEHNNPHLIYVVLILNVHQPMFNACSTTAMGKENFKSLKISYHHKTNFRIQVWGFEFLALLFFQGNLSQTKTKPNHLVWGKLWLDLVFLQLRNNIEAKKLFRGTQNYHIICCKNPIRCFFFVLCLCF